MLALVVGRVYAYPMADNSNPSHMEDLDFARTFLGERQTIGATVYSPAEKEEVIADLMAQGFILTASERLI